MTLSYIEVNVKELDSLVQRIRIFNKGMGMDLLLTKVCNRKKRL